MKLRIRGNSVRFRLSQTEVDQLGTSGTAEDRAQFGPQSQLTYRVIVVADGALRATFDRAQVVVEIPRSTFERWLDPQQVSIRGEQPVTGDEGLKILVEKDFACLAPRADEDDADLFPNPAAPDP
jgi:hypothetical protein